MHADFARQTSYINDVTAMVDANTAMHRMAVNARALQQLHLGNGAPGIYTGDNAGDISYYATQLLSSIEMFKTDWQGVSAPILCCAALRPNTV
jgi:hypothetical protein